MKKKIALLLASVMTLSMLPMTVFASTNNGFSRQPATVPEDTVYYEDGMIGSVTAKSTAATGEDFDYAVDGPDLVLKTNDKVMVGDTIRLQLQNSRWFFRSVAANPYATTSASAVTVDGTATGTRMSISQAYDQMYVLNYLRPSGTVMPNLASQSNLMETTENFLGTVRPSTYNYANGLYFRDKAYSDQSGVTTKSKVGTYYRFPKSEGTTYEATTGNRQEIPYALSVAAGDDTRATLQILTDTTARAATSNPSYTNGDAIGKSGKPTYYEIRIPLASLTTEAKDLKISVADSTLATISSGTYLYGSSAGNSTVTSVNAPATARDDFPLVDRLTIKEGRVHSLDGGDITLTAPDGFEWVDPTAVVGGKNVTKVALEYGLTWRNSPMAGLSGYGTWGTNYTVKYADNDYYGGRDLSKLVISFPNDGLVPSTAILGSIYVEGLKLYATDESAPYGEIKVAIKGGGTTETTFVAGTRKEWTSLLYTTGDIPTLVNGRYIPDQTRSTFDGMNNAADVHHKVAHFIFEENSVSSWWAGRQAVLRLNPGVKFRKVKVTDTDNLVEGPFTVDNYTTIDNYSSALKDAKYTSTYYGRALTPSEYVNDGEKHGYITINDDNITLTNLMVLPNKRAKIQFDAWVSIESTAKTDDVTLTLEGYGIPNQLQGTVSPTDTAVAPCVIAHQTPPVTVKVDKINDLKVGYQYQKTADITITETAKGRLLANKQVRVSITDFITNYDMVFTTDSKVSVTDSNLTIKNFSVNSGGYAQRTGGIASGSALSLQGNGGSLGINNTGTLTFDVSKVSTDKPAVIKLTNLSVKMDRDIPVTNYINYKAVVWGTAIAENYGVDRDEFPTAGLNADYAKVVTATVDKANVLSQEVKVVMGESYYTVNGESFPMDAAAYVSTESNSAMVPVRFVANAFGLSNDNQVIWDPENGTVTLILPTKVVQFKSNSSVMKINGADINMISPDGKTVKSEIKGDRMYLPMRSLGDAFGVPVSWNADDTSVTYNKDANTNKGLADTNPAGTAAAPAVSTTTTGTTTTNGTTTAATK